MKKQVLVIGPGMEIGGVEKSLLGLLDAMDYDQFDVDLFLFWHRGEWMPYINKKVHLLPEYPPLALTNLPIARLALQGHGYTAGIRAACKLYGDWRAKRLQTAAVGKMLCQRLAVQSMPAFPKEYDYALGFLLPHDLLTEKVKARGKIGWVHTDYTSKTERPDVAFLLPMWEKLNFIACVSEGVKRAFCTVFPMLSPKTVTIENILSPSLIEQQAGEADVSQEMPEEGGAKILSVGRFCAAKAFDRIPRVCRQLKDQGYHFRWYLIGYGPEEGLIREQIRACGMEERVILLGRKTNPYPYMKACSFYVQPSLYEGKAVTVREAQALHKPVIITRYPTADMQLREGVDGYICEQSEEGIGAAVRLFIDHPEIPARLAENTRKISFDASAEIGKLWALKK